MRLWPRRRHICLARSPMPMGLMCIRGDKHTQHAAFDPKTGEVYERWYGDHPYDPVEAWAPFMETVTRLLWNARVATGATSPEDASGTSPALSPTSRS